MEELYRAGRTIGNLERMLVLTLVLAGELSAVGFVVAAKSIVRWEMTRSRAEYFLIGTLASVGTAVATGLLARAWIGAALP